LERIDTRIRDIDGTVITHSLRRGAAIAANRAKPPVLAITTALIRASSM